MMAATLWMPISAITPMAVPAVRVAAPAMATVRRTPKRGSSRRQMKVPTM